MISLSEEGNQLIHALQDPDIKDLAWRRHGFRTGVSGTINDLDQFDVAGLPSKITHITPMPNYAAMENYSRTWAISRTILSAKIWRHTNCCITTK